VEVEVAPAAALEGAVRRFDPATRRLTVSEVLPQASLVFQLAHQVALLRADELIEPELANARLEDPAALPLARLSLASYFAGAVLMPYEPFLDAAREGRYDIELLEHRFRASFEQVCHRLSTLGRPGNSGVPLHFVRIDIAGNISKRFSRSGIRFARYSGSCPRWNVHSAFLTPGAIRTQLSVMPDGARFFCVARTVRKAGGGHRIPQSRMAIGLGCELSHAREFVYSDGLDLGSEESIVPIGTACRLCERMDCRQRAFPPMHQQLVVDEHVRGLTAYANPKR
jgi:predicted transcriptional regulator